MFSHSPHGFPIAGIDTAPGLIKKEAQLSLGKADHTACT